MQEASGSNPDESTSSLSVARVLVGKAQGATDESVPCHWRIAAVRCAERTLARDGPGTDAGWERGLPADPA